MYIFTMFATLDNNYIYNSYKACKNAGAIKH